jgi:hypothetical protein
MGINIKFSKEQYKQLVEMMYLGEWMINACRNPNETIKKYEELEQHVYSFAEKANLEHCIEYDEKSKNYYPTRWLEMESEVEQYREEFEEETFWDELIERLSQRDLINEVGWEAVEKMDPIARMKKQDPLRTKYGDEFEKHGLSTLAVVPQKPAKEKSDS